MSYLLILSIAVVVIALIAVLAARRVMRRQTPTSGSYRRALELIAIGDTTNAANLLREAVEQNTDNIGAYLHLGRLLRLRGDADRALRIHRELSVRQLTARQNRHVKRELLADLVETSRWEEVKTTALELQKLGVDDLRVLKARGKAHENLREWDDAIKVFEEIERRREKPSKRNVALFRAYVGQDFERRGKPKEAKRYYEAALKDDPTLPAALLRLGDIHKQEGNVDKAIEAWETLIRKNANAPSIVFDRLEEATYEKDPALITNLAAAYESILGDAPNDVSTMRALASLHRRRGDTDEALRVLEMALEQQPQNLRLRMGRVLVLGESGDRETADKEYKKILKSVIESTGFTCGECGYQSKEYLWRCPSCRRWETFQE